MVLLLSSCTASAEPHTARTTVQVNQLALYGFGEGLDLDEESELARSSEAAIRVRGILHVDTPADQLLAGLKVTPDEDEALLHFDYTDPDAERAEQLSSEFAREYVASRNATKSSQARKACDSMRDEVRRLQRQVNGPARQVNAGSPSDDGWAATNARLSRSYSRSAYLKQQLIQCTAGLPDSSEIPRGDSSS